MRNAGLPASIATKLQPHIGQPLGVTFLQVLLQNDFDTAAPFLGRHGTIVPSEQPERPAQGDTAEQAEQQEASNYCTCGWPFNLLVPRGLRKDAVSASWRCARTGRSIASAAKSLGSLASFSACARDAHPDLVRWKDPFNARFADAITDVAMANANMAFRDFTIRRMPDVDSDD